MLLCYVVHFLNFVLVAANTKLFHGWNSERGELRMLGGVYWIPSDKLFMSSSKTPVPCVFIGEDGDKCLVVRIHARYNKVIGGISVRNFFEHGTLLQTHNPTPVPIDTYYFLPYEIYKVEGTPDNMRLYGDNDSTYGRLTRMESLDAFHKYFEMADGWDVGSVATPGGVYWIDPSILEITTTYAAHIPCIVFPLDNDNNMHGAIMMSYSQMSGGTAAEMFFSAQNMKMGMISISIQELYIHFDKFYKVKGDPKIMKRWGKESPLLVMKKKYVHHLLEAASVDSKKQHDEDNWVILMFSGMVDGWDAGQHGPLIGRVYWILPHVLGLPVKARVFIPCLVIPGRVGNKYLVVRMTIEQLSDEYHVRAFFGNADLRTGIPIPGLHDLEGYYIYPRTKYEVEGYPKIMRKWKTGNLLEISKEGLDRLVVESEIVDGWTGQPKFLFSAIYWINPIYLENLGPAKAGVYVPCLVLGHQYENVYLVVRMSDNLKGQALHAIFQEEGADIDRLRNYQIYPYQQYYVQANPKIMQRLGEGIVTRINLDLAHKLMPIVDSIRNGQHIDWSR